MYDEYSRQALPPKKYRELLGSAICVFNSNNHFVIEKILRVDSSSHSWYDLIDKTSGQLTPSIKETITRNSDSSIADLFSSLTSKRNRIIHSFQVTENGEQILRTKTKDHDQFTITESYLLEFIRDNENLSSMLYSFRGH
ncbi:MAG: selenium binding protein [Sphingobacteriales bacterium]|nr:MAG: selenium binding protein [Sphingobacteriales bacterium]